LSHEDLAVFIQSHQGRFPVPWEVRSAKKWLFHTPFACGEVVDFFVLKGKPKKED